MQAEPELYYIHRPVLNRPASPAVEIMPVQDFLRDEPACRALWDLLGSQFRTRSKFLAIWPSVRWVAVHRTGDDVDGLLLISTAVNWQIDYVVVRPESRRRGIAAALVDAAVNRACELNVPYIMMTSRESLRPLYEGQCGFRVVGRGPGAARDGMAAAPQEEICAAS
jgi:ribosomal protein S18 acetylase RimI-like enzyme